MKILKLILLLAGIVLIVFGVYYAFIPVEIPAIKPIIIKNKEGFNTQAIGMIGLGILALAAGALLKNRR